VADVTLKDNKTDTFTSAIHGMTFKNHSRSYTTKLVDITDVSNLSSVISMELLN